MNVKRKIDWEHIYILGWYDRKGEPYLTSWMGERLCINVVITGLDRNDVPVWKAKVPEGVELHEIPEDKDPHEYAKELGGIYAFGWYFEDGDIKRDE